MAYEFGQLTYTESKFNIECPHLLVGKIPNDLVYLDRVIDKLEVMLEGYGEYNQDFVTVINRDVFCVYFKEKSAALRFKLSW